MDERGVRPEAVSSGAEWLDKRREVYSRAVLSSDLRAAGYSDAEVEAAWELADQRRAAESVDHQDLRTRAALITTAAFLGVWAVLSLWLMADKGSGYGALLAVILAACLFVVLLASLIGIAVSERLRQGAEGAMVAVLVVPFIMLFILAGLCVSATRGASG